LCGYWWEKEGDQWSQELARVDSWASQEVCKKQGWPTECCREETQEELAQGRAVKTSQQGKTWPANAGWIAGGHV
jgi:hypothetical protein